MSFESANLARTRASFSDDPLGCSATGSRPGISEARAHRYMGHAHNGLGDRYRHRLRGQLAEDAKRLEEYLRAEPAEVVTLPTGAQTGAQEAQAASLSGTG